MNIDKKRIKNAIEILKTGNGYTVDGLYLGMADKKNMYITGYTAYSNLDFLTKKIALHELFGIKQTFQELVSASDELKAFIEDKEIEYNLAYFYGKGGFGICSEKDGIIRWHHELNN